MGLFDIFKKKKQTKEVDVLLLQQKMYQDIFSKIQEFLPQGWKKVDFHVYHTSSSFGIKYYVMTEKNEWIDCYKLLDNKLRTKLFSSIYDGITNIWNQLPKKHKWHVLNMIVDNQGHIDVAYDYADDVKDNEEKLFSYLYNEEKEWDKKFVGVNNIESFDVKTPKKNVEIEIWGRNFSLGIEWNCYEGEHITQSQIEALEHFLNNPDWIKNSKKVVEDFCKNDVLDDENQKKDNIFSYLKPECIFVKHSEQPKVAIMCKYLYDQEHGLAVVFDKDGKITVGIQDIIL